VLLAVLAVVGGCQKREGMWRDQLIFVGDDGTVLHLAMVRHSDGEAEAKGLIGRTGTWQTNFYRRFVMDGRRASQLDVALSTWNQLSPLPARVRIERREQKLEAELRLPDAKVGLRANKLVALGTHVDPEGTTVFHGGRAQMWTREFVVNGWLLTERVPADKPIRAHVDYGDFAFFVLASKDRGLLWGKYSRRYADFSRVVWLSADAVPKQSRALTFAVDPDRVRLAARDFPLDVSVPVVGLVGSGGVAPDGAPLRYEALLLEGELAGVVFAIRKATPD